MIFAWLIPRGYVHYLSGSTKIDHQSFSQAVARVFFISGNTADIGTDVLVGSEGFMRYDYSFLYAFLVRNLNMEVSSIGPWKPSPHRADGVIGQPSPIGKIPVRKRYMREFLNCTLIHKEQNSTLFVVDQP